MNWWKIAAGHGGAQFDDFTSKNVVAMFFEGLGDVRGLTREQLMRRAEQAWPEAAPRQRVAIASQLWRFIHEVQRGDRVVVFNPAKREYAVGTITSDYMYKQDFLGPEWSHVYEVLWEPRHISRGSLPVACQNGLGAILAIFKVSDYAPDLESALTQPHGTKPPTVGPPPPGTGTEDEDWFSGIQGAVKERLADKISKLDPWQVQDLVAGLLQAMGYRTKTSPPGPDGGVDVLAHPDEFGFGRPLIKVQVKHRQTSASAPELQQLLGAQPSDANALFVSTGGFTSAALGVAKHQQVATLDLDDLVEKVGEYYDRLPTEVQTLIPMRKMYLPL